MAAHVREYMMLTPNQYIRRVGKEELLFFPYGSAP